MVKRAVATASARSNDGGTGSRPTFRCDNVIKIQATRVGRHPSVAQFQELLGLIRLEVETGI
jgi:hypothetical protein